MSGALWTGPVLIPVLVPLAIALALAAPRLRGPALRVAPWAAAPALASACFAPGGAADLPWLLLGARVGLDPTGRVVLGVTALVWLCAGIFAAAARRHDRGRTRFFAFYLTTMSGNLGLTLALDAVTFQLCYALMGFAAYGLVVHARTPAAFRAGRLYLAFVVLSDIALFTGAALLYPAAASPLWTAIPAAAQTAPAGRAALLLLLTGFAIKAGVAPLHFWMPAAYTSAPTAGSAVLAGAMINAGLLGWLRVVPVGGAGFSAIGRAWIVAGLVSAFFGVIAGVVQRHPKTVLAYSSISQMGLAAAGVGAALVSPEGGPLAYTALLLFGAHHSLVKGAFFLGVGIAPDAHTRRQRIAAAGGLLLLAVVLIGAPLTSGDAAKDALKHGMALLPARWADWVGRLWPLATAGTALIMARVLFLVWREADGPTGEWRRERAWPGGGGARWWAWFVLLGAVLSGAWWLPALVHAMSAP